MADNINNCIIEGCKNLAKHILDLDDNNFILDFLPKPTYCKEHTPEDTRPYKKRTLRQILNEKKIHNTSSDDEKYESLLLKLNTTQKRTDFKKHLREMNQHHFCIVEGCVNTAGYNYMSTEPIYCYAHSNNEMDSCSYIDYMQKYVLF